MDIDYESPVNDAASRALMALDDSVARISRAAQFMLYGGDAAFNDDPDAPYDESPRSSNESASTLPDQSNMTPRQIANSTGDMIAVFADDIRRAYRANKSNDKMRALSALVSYAQDVGLNNAQIGLLRRERGLAHAVEFILFHSPDVTQFNADRQYHAATVLVPLFQIPRRAIVEFMVRTWGAAPSVQFTGITYEYRNVRTARGAIEHQTRVIKPTSHVYSNLASKSFLQSILIGQWIDLALPPESMVSASDRNDIMTALVDIFFDVNEFNPASLCLHMVLAHTLEYGLVENERTGESLLKEVALRDNNTLVVMNAIYPALGEAYPSVAAESLKVPFDASSALSIAMSCGASKESIIAIMARALRTSSPPVNETDLGEMLTSFALQYGRADILEMDEFINRVRYRHKISPEAERIPLVIVKSIMLDSRPSLWQWLFTNCGYGNNADDFAMVERRVDAMILESNRQWILA